MHNGVKDRVARPEAGPAPAIDHLRLVLAGLLLVVVIAGIRIGPALTWRASWHGPWHDRQQGIVLVIALELILTGLLIALRILKRRSPDPGSPARKLRPALTRVIVPVMIALAVPLAGLFHLPKTKPKPKPTPQPSSVPRHLKQTGLGPSQGTDHMLGEIILYLLLALVVATLVAAFVILLRRMRPAERDLELVPEDDEGTILREAVEAGRIALGELSEPRMAIINCYLAMERSLARAGAERIAAETPDELLTRSLGAGLLHGSAPAELTSLFYEARFSSHPVPQSSRDMALQALDVISAYLRDSTRTGQAPAGTAAAP